MSFHPLLVWFALLIPIIAVRGDIFSFKPAKLNYHGDASQKQKSAYLNNPGKNDSRGAVLTAQTVSNTLGLDSANFTLYTKLSQLMENGCPGEGFVFSFGGGMSCLMQERISKCDGVNLVYDQGHFFGSQGVYLIKEGELVDFVNRTLNLTEIDYIEIKMEVINVGGNSRIANYYFNGEDIFEAKASKGYDIKFSLNDLSDNQKFGVGGVTSPSCPQIYRVRQLQIDVEGVKWSQSIKNAIGKYVKRGTSNNYSYLFQDVADGLMYGDFRTWMPFGFGFLVVGVWIWKTKASREKKSGYEHL